jgi:hypothetical protein
MRKALTRYLPAAIALAALCFPVRVLEVKSRAEDRVFFLRRVAPGETFEIHYIHSVEKIPVAGRFAVTAAGAIRPVETRFASFGAGLPYLQGEVALEKDTMRATAAVEDIEVLTFFVSGFTRQQLHFGQERVAFGAQARDGDVVEIRVAHHPLGRVILDYVAR